VIVNDTTSSVKDTLNGLLDEVVDGKSSPAQIGME
jgi:hypothetical protein